MAKYEKPQGVDTDDFGFALNIINADAVIEIMGYGAYGTPQHRLVCEWDDDKGAFPTADEMKAAVVRGNWDRVRKHRNGLLDATDWCAHVDSPAMNDAMKTYRQSLRDLPATYENPSDVVWPEAPE